MIRMVNSTYHSGSVASNYVNFILGVANNCTSQTGSVFEGISQNELESIHVLSALDSIISEDKIPICEVTIRPCNGLRRIRNNAASADLYKSCGAFKKPLGIETSTGEGSVWLKERETYQ